MKQLVKEMFYKAKNICIDDENDNAAGDNNEDDVDDDDDDVSYRTLNLNSYIYYFIILSHEMRNRPNYLLLQFLLSMSHL